MQVYYRDLDSQRLSSTCVEDKYTRSFWSLRAAFLRRGIEMSPFLVLIPTKVGSGPLYES